MSDEPLEAVLRALPEPPQTPRDRMWEHIEPAVRSRHAVRPHRRMRLAPIAGIAAVLALGIGIGRYTARSPGIDAASHAIPNLPPRAFAHLLEEHLHRSEMLLVSISSGADVDIAAPAHELLSTTRLLLDSPPAGDAGLRRLLEDLELLFVQASQLQGDPSAIEYVRSTLEERGLLTRLRRVSSRPSQRET